MAVKMNTTKSVHYILQVECIVFSQFSRQCGKSQVTGVAWHRGQRHPGVEGNVLWLLITLCRILFNFFSHFIFGFSLLTLDRRDWPVRIKRGLDILADLKLSDETLQSHNFFEAGVFQCGNALLHLFHAGGK